MKTKEIVESIEVEFSKVMKTKPSWSAKEVMNIHTAVVAQVLLEAIDKSESPPTPALVSDLPLRFIPLTESRNHRIQDSCGNWVMVTKSEYDQHIKDGTRP